MVFWYNVGMDNTNNVNDINMATNVANGASTQSIQSIQSIQDVQARQNNETMTITAMSYAFLIGLLDSICAAMPSWCAIALTLGFGLIFGLPVSLVIYLILCLFNRAKYSIVEITGWSIYVAIRIVSFFFGCIVSVGIAWLLPFVALSPNSPSEMTVLSCYLACIVVLIGLTWAMRRLAAHRLRIE